MTIKEEAAREREVHRYYQTWLDSSLGYNPVQQQSAPKRYHLDGTPLKPSNDKALTAFAQLGCLRLNAKRGIVTLISEARQYILAEATKTLTLVSELVDEEEKDQLWFGNASIPRSQGVSEVALNAPEYTAHGHNGTTYTAPAIVINDVTKDDRSGFHPAAGNGVVFYCGVPITAPSGYVIGVYTVTDDKPRNGLTPLELVFLQDMAQTVMQHLETVHSHVARTRGERMVSGLRSFMQGRSSLHDRHASATVYSSPQDDDLPQPSREKHFQNVPLFKGMDITDADPTILTEIVLTDSGSRMRLSRRRSSKNSPKGLPRTPNTELDEPVDTQSQAKPGNDSTPPAFTTTTIRPRPGVPSRENGTFHTSNLQQIFDRAAAIVRECVEADGVIFYDAVPTAQRKLSSKSETGKSRGSETDRKITQNKPNLQTSPSTSDEESSSETNRDHQAQHDASPEPGSMRCPVLGCALDVFAHASKSINTIQTTGLDARSLRRLLRRFPNGGMFHYTSEGQFVDNDTQINSISRSDRLHPNSPRKQDHAFIKTVATQIISVLPGARNVFFLPLWDSSRQRWRASMFLWSQTSEGLLSIHRDLIYLRTFATSIMIEVSRIDVQSADQAKSRFIANISHELRSPLHGVLGSIEFLQETTLDAFQSSMALGVETCAKTLLDTVEHVLEYSKINQMSANSSQRHGSRGSSTAPEKNPISAITDDVDLALLFEEAVEAVFAGQTFRSPGGMQKFESPILLARSTKDKSREEQIQTIQRQSNKFSGKVRVILKIEKQDNWWTNTQTGAIRRVIINVLGNSFKYTDAGKIMVSLTTCTNDSETTDQRTVCICVRDTGRGMSQKFLQNHAFTPFAQESEFSAGTGLGLSIVKQIVSSLDGQIDLQSEKDVGTQVKIFITLPVIIKVKDDDSADLLYAVQQKTPGMSLCILHPDLGDDDHPKSEDEMPRESVEKSLLELSEEWFGIRTIKAKTMDDIHTDFFVYAEPPPIEYLMRHHGTHTRSTEIPIIIMATNAFECASLVANGIHQLTDVGRIVEIISQPCGPQKFAKAVHRCLTRLEKLASNPEAYSNSRPVSPGVSDDPDIELSHNGVKHLRDGNSYLDEEKTPHEKFEEKVATNNASESSKDDRSNQSKEEEKLEDKDHHQHENITSKPSPPTSSQSKPPPKSTNQASISPMDDRGPVLLVDDNEINLNLLVAFMKKAKLPFEKARNGQEAVEAYKRACNDPQTAFKSVLMDISMPIMDGIEATRQIRQHETKSELEERATIVALTGLAAASTREEMFAAGADYYLAKPVKFKELMDQLFRQSQHRGAANQ